MRSLTIEMELPTADIETALLAEGCSLVGGIDEVGRGAWAGPVSVGVSVVNLAALTAMPIGLRDSKALSPSQRERMFPALAAACVAYAVGHASPAECDELGMTAAQGLATRRAIAELSTAPDAVIVDGRHDFTGHPRSVLVVGGDRCSLAVAAASVLAKVTRDAILVASAREFPDYGFERHKGYCSAEHRAAVRARGLTRLHRRRWAVAGFGPEDDAADEV
jgi:ribonuclease HII